MIAIFVVFDNLKVINIEFFNSFSNPSSLFVLCVLARSCSILVLHWKWRKQRKEQSHAQCHVTHRIKIFDKVSEHVKVAKSLYQRFPLQFNSPKCECSHSSRGTYQEKSNLAHFFANSVAEK